MGRTLYLECSAGISGDMTVAALLDLGADREAVRRALDSLNDGSFRIETHRVMKAGIDCESFDVITDAAHETHDHDMAYLYGHLHGGDTDVHDHDHGHPHDHDHDHSHEHPHDHDHDHGHEHPHDHDHDHGHEHTHEHGHVHEHRTFAEIRGMLGRADMTEGARDLAVRIFSILAAAEAKAHAVPEDQVHFHEVGAIDSIADIAAAAVCIDSLDLDEVIVPRFCEGRGTVRCAHGILPVPVPATANICAQAGIPLHIMDEQGEFVTPTGAAIAAAVMTGTTLPENYVVRAIGLGAGKREYRHASILRAYLIETSGGQETGSDRICKLETNIDDCTGEQLSFTLDMLMDAGARDAFFLPAFMKKGRPAYQLNVICGEQDVPRMERIIFENTTTIGIRRVMMDRTVLARRVLTVRTPYGPADVKACRIGDKERFYPEYRSVASICASAGISYADAVKAVLEAAENAE